MADIFAPGNFYPHEDHEERIERYRKNKKLFKGFHYDVFERVHNRLSKNQRNLVYIAVNLPGLICKKSADFLFGESPTYSAGKEDKSNEQKALERLVQQNDLNITNYETALSNAFRGDAFYKIRWGQQWGGILSKDIDPFRIFIEAQNPEYVFPEVSPTDANKIIAYHIAYPQLIEADDGERWVLNVESHYPGKIRYRRLEMTEFNTNLDNEVIRWKIQSELSVEKAEVSTGVPFPLVVHVPNYALDDSWEGIDDLSELEPLFDELNNRLSQIAVILDKHADPAIAVPAGSLTEDEKGNPVFHVGRDKVFEVLGKEDITPEYITWDGKLDAAFKELEFLVDKILLLAEIPPVALGKDNSGTSGASGLSIKWRMNSLLAKINRKRQYYDKGLKQVLLIAQMLEHAQMKKAFQRPDYEVTVPIIQFKDGLPDDDLEQAQIAQVRTGGKPIQSQLSAIMEMRGLTEEQALREIERIREEEKAELTVNASIFNRDTETPEEENGGEREGEGGDE